MRKLLTAATIILASSVLLTGCGGGGGGSSSTSTVGSSTSTPSSRVTGATYASYVEGAKVCIEDSNKNVITVNGTELCSTTAEDGTFTIQIPQGVTISDDDWVGLYVVDQDGDTIKIADAPITQVEVDNSTNVLQITPESIVAGNETLANQIGALIHAIGGDLDGNATVVDLSDADIENIEVQTSDNQTEPLQDLSNVSLVDLLKEKESIIIENYHKLLGQEYQIEVNATNPQVPVICKLGTKIQQLAYNWKEHQQEIEEHLQALQYLASGNVQQFEIYRLVSLIDSLSNKLQAIASSGLVPADEVNEIQSVVSELTGAANDIKTNGLTEDTKDEIQSTLTDVNSLIEALSSTNNFSIRRITFSLQRLASVIESIIQNSTEVESTQQTSNETQVQLNQEVESSNQTQAQINQEIQSFHQTQGQVNQELQSSNQTQVQANQELESSNQTQVQMNQELQNFHQTQAQTNQQVHSSSQTQAQINQELQSFNQTQIQVNQELQNPNQIMGNQELQSNNLQSQSQQSNLYSHIEINQEQININQPQLNQEQPNYSQELQSFNQTQTQTNQELQSSNQTQAQVNQELQSGNQTQAQVNQELHEELQSSNQTQS